MDLHWSKIISENPVLLYSNFKTFSWLTLVCLYICVFIYGQSYSSILFLLFDLNFHCSVHFSYCFLFYLMLGFYIEHADIDKCRINKLYNYCYYIQGMPITSNLPFETWTHRTFTQLFTLLMSANKVFHVLKQDVTGWEVEKGIPIGLKQVHSFTLRCLLCNPSGCHGDHMLWQVNMAQCQETRGLVQETLKPGAMRHMHTFYCSS